MTERAWLRVLVLLAAIGPLAAAAEDDALVRRGTFTKTLVVTGVVSAGRAEVYSVPTIPGQWQLQISWLVAEGVEVAPGDLLIQFDPSMLSGELTKARASLAEKQQLLNVRLAELERERVDRELATRQAVAAHDKAILDAAIPPELLPAREHRGKEIELERTARALEEARLSEEGLGGEVGTEVKRIGIEIDTLTAQVERLERQVALLGVRARSRGVTLIGLDSRSGRPFQAGDTAPWFAKLVETPDPSALEVEAWVNEVDVRSLRPGQSASLRLDAIPERTFPGRLESVAAMAQTRKQWGKAPHYRAVLSVDRPDLPSLRPGMSVQCEVTVLELADVLLVPLDHVCVDGERHLVHPVGGEALAVEPLAVDPFLVAVDPAAGLADGTALADCPVTTGGGD